MTPILRSSKLNGKSNTNTNTNSKVKSISKTSTPTITPTATPKSANNKRNLSPDVNEHSISKRNKPSKLSTMEIDELKKIILDSTTRVENKIDKSHNLL